jgi:endonuclease-8
MQRAIGGKLCTGFETGLALLARVNDDTPIAGRMIEKVEARGKWLLVYFSGDRVLLTHMLMSGSWHLYRTGERWRMGKDRMRAVIRTADWQAVAFNVPVAEFHTERSLARSSQVPKLGVDVLGEGYTAEGGAARLKAYGVANPEVEVGVALLNQRVLAGLGNVYKSEVAFAAGVHPFRSLATVTDEEYAVMADVSGRWLRANVADGAGDGIVTYAGSRRTTGASNAADRLWVYGRAGQECRRCGGRIETRKQGVAARTSFWCPSCQPFVAVRSHASQSA